MFIQCCAQRHRIVETLNLEYPVGFAGRRITRFVSRSDERRSANCCQLECQMWCVVFSRVREHQSPR